MRQVQVEKIQISLIQHSGRRLSKSTSKSLFHLFPLSLSLLLLLLLQTLTILSINHHLLVDCEHAASFRFSFGISPYLNLAPNFIFNRLSSKIIEPSRCHQIDRRSNSFPSTIQDRPAQESRHESSFESSIFCPGERRNEKQRSRS